ncbi:MAG TPA: type VI secretion system-associated protein TagF [Gammaproteobacteria bacterium]|nr:type VI secretion system-associated protein TagF [Gammaproteobacteria bacterium]
MLRAGYYGKIPSKGDFITRHLPGSFVEPWDQWLQSSIAASKTQLGEQWLDFYLTCPIWRFVISRTVCDEQAWAGILIPSVDRVGRYFPFSIALPLGVSNHLLTIAGNEDEWFNQAETLALTALDRDRQLEEFDHSLDELGLPPGLTNPGDSSLSKEVTSGLNNSGHWHLSCGATSTINRSLITLLEQLLYERLDHFSAWWTNGSEHIEPSLLICKDLPSAESFSALLDGHWQTRGWDNPLNLAATTGTAQQNAGVENI